MNTPLARLLTLCAGLMAVIAAVLLCGCATVLTADDADNGALLAISNQAKAQAVQWYARKYDEPPRNIPYRHIRLTDSPDRGAAWTCGKTIYVWRDRVWVGNIEHEWRHAFNFANGRGGACGTVEAEEAVR